MTDSSTVKNPAHYSWFEQEYGVPAARICEGLGFYLGNAFKYMVRAGRKQQANYTIRQSTAEDLRKAIQYLQFKIEEIEGAEGTERPSRLNNE